VRYHHGISARRRSGAGDNPLLPDDLCAGVQARQRLEDVTAIDDPKLKDKRIGIVAKTPPSTNMAINGLLGRAKSYRCSSTPARIPRRRP